ncbi:preprotein translocase subunit SecE [Cellvibrio japonicus]|uniref:Protein translocase subunit SecE n=1 Tax=Cellvibrio japonicus (strain Ueda107) TaxID=498211 RepID=B3PK24_CELJU|nr:preprotein translocase subunit SecE [Cellvibrio japonicus]ACE84250.1 preprotein translocase, SecE subunit [Cellvibrio japonicus Ueda107]QEI11346.1 preprotein translocase subunit SecE [Cellvibrio japonicus]QEI14920.1 preprotein translocase subunit SecE [Cellvibrio japonicus]QEI18500.1 preprotein translocase subunit SecE [Cellvibrio japonicus]
MTTNTEEKVYRLDALKWALVIALVSVGVYGNSYYSAESVLYRAIALLALAGVAILIATNTAKGSAIVDVIRGAFVELRKVVWPTRQETNQTTLIVVALVIVTSIILWLLDTLLGFIASSIIG